jgi:hypothetical protein
MRKPTICLELGDEDGKSPVEPLDLHALLLSGGDWEFYRVLTLFADLAMQGWVPIQRIREKFRLSRKRLETILHRHPEIRVWKPAPQRRYVYLPDLFSIYCPRDAAQDQGAANQLRQAELIDQEGVDILRQFDQDYRRRTSP